MRAIAGRTLQDGKEHKLSDAHPISAQRISEPRPSRTSAVARAALRAHPKPGATQGRSPSPRGASRSPRPTRA